MKILLINKFHVVIGGSETYYFGLGDMLKERGHEVLYFSMQDERNRPCEQAKYFSEHMNFNGHAGLTDTIKMSARVLYNLDAKKKLEKLLEDEKPDVIHLNLFQSQLSASVVDAAKKYHIPIVYTAHELKSICPNYQMLSHGEICEKCLHGNYTKCFQSKCMKDSRAKSLLATMEAYVYKWKKTYENMDTVITPSAFYKKKIEEAGVMKCPIIHIPNFLPEGTVYSDDPQKGDYLLYFGRLGKEKGILTLVRAYAAAKVKEPLYIAGTGAMEESIRKIIAKKHLEDKVVLLGFKSGQELKDLVANAMCVFLPSEWYENGPYSIMEAQAAGRPVVVSEFGGLPELVNDGENGYIVKAKDVKDLAEKMRTCCKKNDWDHKAIVEYARKKYDPIAYVEKVEEIYCEVCSKK